MASLFEKLDAGKVAPVEQVVGQLRRNAPQIERLLDWLVNRWPGNTITTRQIRIYGPRPRDRKTVMGLTQTLVEQGWFAPVEGYRHDQREWKIAGKSFKTPPATDSVAKRSRRRAG